jgi:hypothetical protein
VIRKIQLKRLLTAADQAPEQQLALFALMSLGILDTLNNGLLIASDSLRLFFHAKNCLFPHQQLRNHAADEIMSRGVQLPDLFDILPAEQAQREFQRELTHMRSLCLALLDNHKITDLSRQSLVELHSQ